MPNYLQRILISGARTAPSAKPIAFSHSLMPPISGPVRARINEDSIPAAKEFSEPAVAAQHLSRQEPPQATEHMPAIQEGDGASSVTPPRGKVSREVMKNRDTDRGAAVPLSDISPLQVTPYPSAVGAHIRAPKGLRRQEGGNEREQAIMRAVGETLRAVTSSPTGTRAEADRSSEPPTEFSGSAFSGKSQVTLEKTGRLHSDPSVVSLMPRTTIPSVLPANIPTVENAKQKSTTASQPDTVPSQVVPSITSQSIDIKPIGKEEVSEVSSLVLPKTTGDRQSRDTSYVEVKATAPQQISTPAVPGMTDKRRRSQISIGRIDVQVNNLPAPPPATPQPTKTSTRSNFLDTRYLSRFFLRP